MAAIDEAWLELAAVHAALEVHRGRLDMTWRQVAAATGASAGTVARFARDLMPTEADGVFCLLDWLGLPAETFVRRRRPDAQLDLAAKLANLVKMQPGLPPGIAAQIEAAVVAGAERGEDPRPDRKCARMIEAPEVGPGVTRIDGLALHAALDARRIERGLTWRDVRSEMGFPLPGMFSNSPRQAAPNDLGRRGLGARQEAHACVAMAHWLGVPLETFLRRLDGRKAPSSGLLSQIRRLILNQPGLSPEAAAALDEAARTVCERLLPAAAATPKP